MQVVFAFKYSNATIGIPNIVGIVVRSIMSINWSELFVSTCVMFSFLCLLVYAVFDLVCVHFQTPEFGTSDATAEAQQSLFEIQEELRQISVQTHRINTKLDLLRTAGSKQQQYFIVGHCSVCTVLMFFT